MLPFPGSPRGFELHGVRIMPMAPCLKCSARALPNSEMCFAHAELDEREAYIPSLPFEENAILNDVSDGRKAAA